MEEQKLESNPVGRPSSYDPSFCDKVRALGKLGKSFEQMAMQLDVSYRTLCRWRESEPEFCHALEDAQAYAQAWWEEMGQAYLVNQYQGNSLNASLWSRSMAARFPKTYSERVKQEITGANGAPLIGGIEVTFVEPLTEENKLG